MSDISGAGTAAPSGQVVGGPSTLDVENPWPGPEPFREADSAFFHGRESAIEALLDLVRSEPVAAIYGVSGLGKTSLLNAGLFPRVRPFDLFPVYIRLEYVDAGPDLMAQVVSAIRARAAAEGIEAPSLEGAASCWEYLYRKDAVFWSARNRIVTPLLVFDQFEELFTRGRERCPADVRQAFIDDLSGLVSGRPPDAVKRRCDENPDQALRYSRSRQVLRVLFSLREDFLAEFAELPEPIRASLRHAYRLLRMSAADAEHAVILAGGRLVTRSVAHAIVEAVTERRDEPHAVEPADVEPSLLSIFCRELNNERIALGHAELTLDLVRAKRETILPSFYERCVRDLDPAVRDFVEETLITSSGFRDSVAEDNAVGRPGVTSAAIDELIRRRLIRRLETGGVPRLELTHDVLAEPVRVSRERRRVIRAEAARIEAERLADAARRQEEARERERQALALSAAEARATLERERATTAERTAARHRQFLRLQSAFLVVVLVLGALAAFSAWRAEQRKRQATQALALANWEATAKHIATGRTAMGLAHLARATRLAPDDALMRGFLIDLLLRRTWPIPLAVYTHDGPVRWATFSPDGRSIVTASIDGVRVGDWAQSAAASGIDSAPTLFARFDPLGRYVISVTGDGQVRLLDARRGVDRKEEPVAILAHGPATRVTCATFSPNAALVVTCGDDGSVRLWDITSMPPRPRDLPVQPDGVSTVQFNHDGTRLITAAGGLAAVWDVATGANVAKLPGHDATIIAARVSRDGRAIVTASRDGTARIWRMPGVVRHGARPAPAPSIVLRHAAAVWDVQVSPDGTRVLTASQDGTARLWDAATGQPATPALEHEAAVVGAAFSPDGRRVLTASRDGSARLWDAESGAPATEAMWHEASVECAQFSGDGTRVITASEDRTARVWDVRPGVAQPLVLTYSEEPYSARFVGGEGALLVAAADGSVRLSDVQDGRERWRVTPGGVIAGVEVSPDAAVAAALSGADVQLLSMASGQRIATIRHGEGTDILAADFSPDSTQIVTAGSDGTARVWDGRSGVARGVLSHRSAGADASTRFPIWSAEFSDDGFAIVTGADDGRARVWDAKSLRRTAEFDAGAPVHLAMPNRTTTRIVAVVEPGGVSATGHGARLWTVRPGSSADGARVNQPDLGVLLPHDQKVLSARFVSSDVVVTVSEDETARLWDVSDGISRLSVLRHAAPVHIVEASADGRRVVTGSRDGVVRVWQAPTGDPIAASLRHDDVVYTAHLSANGEQIVTASRDGHVRIWNLPVGTGEDVGRLARLGEVIAGQEIGNGTNPVPLEDPIAAVRDARAAAGGAQPDSLAGRIARWVLDDRWTRTISPFSRTTVDAFIRERLDAGSEARREEAIRTYPGHPLLRVNPARPPATGTGTAAPPAGR